MSCFPPDAQRWKRIPLEGTAVREVVHFACPKEPEGRIHLSDGRVIELPFGDIEVATSGRVRIDMRRHGDSSYIVRYSGESLTLAELWVEFDDDPWRDEFSRDIDAWIGAGYRGSPGYVADTRLALIGG